MEYFVKGSDGKEYGPVPFDTLRQWLTEGRVTPHSLLRDFHTGRTMTVGEVQGLVVAPPAHATPTTYGSMPGVRPIADPRLHSDDEDMGQFWGSIVRSIAGVVFFFFLHGIGLVFAGYALYHAIDCTRDGNRRGPIAIVVASIALIAIIIGWMLRIGGAAT